MNSDALALKKGTAELLVLAQLESRPRHGYELKRDYDSLFARSRPVKFGQIYSTLGRLERDGLIDLAAEERGQGPDRKRYAITPCLKSL